MAPPGRQQHPPSGSPGYSPTLCKGRRGFPQSTGLPGVQYIQPTKSRPKQINHISASAIGRKLDQNKKKSHVVISLACTVHF